MNESGRLLIIGGLFLSVTFSSCGDEPPQQLPRVNRVEVDTLFVDTVQVLKPIMDSLCNEMLSTQLQATVDSIYKERKAEIERLKRRVRGNR